MDDITRLIEDVIKSLKSEASHMAYDKVQTQVGPGKGAQKGHGNIGGMRNRGIPGYPVPTRLATTRGTDDRDEAGGLEVLEGGPIDRMTGATDFSGDSRVDNVGLDDAARANEGARDWLKAGVAAAALGMASPTAIDDTEPPPPQAQVQPTKLSRTEMCHAAEKKYGLPHNLLLAMIQIESSGNAGAVSKAGARGILQIMPATAIELGVDDPHDEEQAIEGAGKYMQKLLKRFNGNVTRALQAYNAGPNKHPKKFKVETKKYPKKVLFMKALLDKREKQAGVKEVVETIIREMGMGGSGTGRGYEGGGRGGSGSWSGYNPRGNFLDHDEEDDEDIAALNPSTEPAPGAPQEYQQLARSPSTRMLPMGNHGHPNSDLPSVNKIEGEDDEDQLRDPTDLGEAILNILRKKSVVK
jgi:hypothetical protein